MTSLTRLAGVLALGIVVAAVGPGPARTATAVGVNVQPQATAIIVGGGWQAFTWGAGRPC